MRIECGDVMLHYIHLAIHTITVIVKQPAKHNIVQIPVSLIINCMMS